jgi:hypothetical protein
MLLAVFGVPTATTALGVRVVQTLFGAAYGHYDFLMAGTLDELRGAWSKLSTKNVLFHHESPSGEVISFLREAKAPIIVFLEDPVEVALALCRERGLEVLQAVRASSVSMSLLEELCADRDVLLLRAGGESSRSVRGLVRAVCDHIGLPVDVTLLESTLAELLRVDGQTLSADALWTDLLRPVAVDEPRQQPGEGAVAMMQRCLDHYRLGVLRRPIEQVCWYPEMFVAPDLGRIPLAAPVDMTGKTRVFIDGPWFGLPRGAWEASIEFEVNGNIAGAVLLIGIVAEQFVAKGRAVLPERGQHCVQLEFFHSAPRIPLAIHFVVERGVLQGDFRLLRTVMRRMS